MTPVNVGLARMVVKQLWKELSVCVTANPIPLEELVSWELLCKIIQVSSL